MSVLQQVNLEIGAKEAEIEAKEQWQAHRGACTPGPARPPPRGASRLLASRLPYPVHRTAHP